MENIKIGVQIDANTKEATADAKKYHDQLKQVADAAGKIKVGGVAKAAAQPSGAMASAQPTGSQAIQQYGALRGTAGATGASARDFANQAQGLSGLVRLYAIYAANVYAVSAAFNTLSRAMDTTNMIRGLDQLGAASGRSLQGLAKQFAAAAGGAISARESIEAVAKTSAAGLGSTDIVRLGTAAQKASAALGVNLTDAVSRLSRGITKLEPELLDELGIFTKIEPAVEKYARSIGKASGQLSDFERRQAFATAVLAEAEEKFGKIDIDVNPYSKLAATFANLAQSGLELVNKVLIPVVNVLSSNPVALATVVAAFGANLVKNVIPALKDVTTSLTNFQKQAGERAQGQYKQALAKLIDVPKLDVLNKQLNEASNQAYDQLDKTKANLARRLERLGPIPVRLDKLLKLTPIDAFDPKAAQAMLGGTLTSRQDQKAIQAYINSMQTAIKADAQFGKLFEETNEKVNKRYNIFQRLYSPVANLQAETNKQFLAGVRSNILGNALVTASTESSVKAFKQLYTSVQEAGKETTFKEKLTQIDRNGKEVTKTITRVEKGMGAFQKATTFAAGSAAIVGTAVGRLASGIMGLLPVIALAVAGFEILKQLFDTSQKESERFSQSLGILESAVENVDKTLESLANRSQEKFYNIETVNAVANAFTDLSASITQVAKDSEKLAQARSSFSAGAQRLTQIATLGLVKTDEKKLGEALADSTAQALRLAQKSGQLEQAVKEFSSSLGLDELTVTEILKEGTGKQLTQYIRGNLEYGNSLETLAEKAQKAAELQVKFAQAAQSSADKLNTVKTGLENLTKEVDSYIQGLAPSDPFAKIGSGLINNASKIQTALEDSKDGVLALQQIVNNFKVLAILPEDSQAELLSRRGEINNIIEDIAAGEKRLEDLKANRAKAAGSGEDTKILNNLISNQESALVRLKDSATKISLEFSTKLAAAFTEAGIKQLEISNKLAGEQAGVTAQRGRLGILSQAGVDTAQLEGKLRQQEISIQRRLVDSNVNLAIQTAKLATELELANALAQLTRKRQEVPSTKRDAEIATLETAVKRLEQQSDLISSGKATTIKGIREVQTKGTQEERAALSGSNMQGLVAAIFGAESQKAGLAAQSFVAKLEEQAKVIGEVTARLIGEMQLQEAPMSRELDEVKKQETIRGIYDDQLASKRLALEADLSALKLQQEIAQLYKDIQIIEKTIADTTANSQERKNAEVQLEKVRNQIVQKVLDNEQKGANARFKNLQDRQQAERELFDFDSKAALAVVQNIQEQNQLRLEAADLELSRLSSIEDFNKTIVIDEKARIDTLKLQGQEQQALYELEQKSAELALRKKQAQELGPISQEQARRFEIEAEQLDRQRNLIISKNSLQLAGIEQTRQLSQEQERYNELLKQAAEFSNTIKTAFEGIGTAGERIGNAFSSLVTVLADFSVQSEKNAKNILANEENLAKAREAERNAFEADDAAVAINNRIKAEDELAKSKSKQAKDELSANAKVVGSVKMLFKEKTGAYKVLSAIEKAMHLTRLAMEAKELFTKVTGIKLGLAADVAGEAKETGIATAGFLSRVPVMATEILGKITSQLGIFGPPVAAAIIAAIFGALGRGKSVPVIGAQQQQEVQGTAMGYNAAGEKVQQRTGVFGDVDAKSQSIANSLEIIKDTSVKGMDYNDKLLKSFERLSKNIETVAIQAYQQSGLVRGAVPGIQEGTKDSRPPPLLTAILFGALGLSFLGKKVTTEVIDSGIKLKGSFLDVAKGADGVIEGFARVKTTTKRGVFGKKRVSVADMGIELDPALAQSVEDAFGSALDTAYATAEILNLDLQTLDSRLASLDLTDRIASLRGLKGEELANELQSFFGGIIDEAFELGFDTIAETYRKFGEGAAETVVRVADTNRKIEQQLGNILGTGAALTLGLDVTESLADAAGGLQSFIEKTDGFIDKFLTDAEKLVPTQLAVSRGLDKLGLGWVKTKDQFKQVAQSLDVTTDYGRETFVALMNISEGFDEVATAAEKAFESVKNELKSVAEQRISELKGARDEMQGFAKSLREYQSSLKTGSLSPLTPQQQYEELKREFLTTQQRALGGDVVAMAKLSAAGSSFLQASQKMFASSAEYISDFDLVSSSVDNAASFAEQQVDIANQTLTEIKNVVGALVELKLETEKVPVSLVGFGTALTTALEKYAAEQAKQVISSASTGTVNVISGTVAADIEARAQARIDLANERAAAAERELAALRQAEADRAAAAAASYDFSGYYDPGFIGGAAMGAAFDRGVQRYAKGGVVNSITPFQHVGGLGVMGEAGPEAIMPLQRMPGGNLGVTMGGNFGEQLAKLNQQMAELTQVVANGAVMNAQATDRNTEAVVAAVSDGSESTAYQTRLVNRTKVV